MGSKPSGRPTPTKLETVVVPVVPNIPPGIIGEILDHLARSDSKHLRLCSLVSKLWVPLCRQRLFYTIAFTSKDVEKWLKTFPVPEKGPARYVRDLRFSLKAYYGAPEAFFEHILWFKKVERVTLQGSGQFQPLWTPPFVRLPQSTTSLTVNTDNIPLAKIRNVMVQLPNLNDLWLSGSPVEVGKNTPPGMGKALRGRFGGQLRLLKGHADMNFMNMLLEVPTGLHFTELQIRGPRECLVSIVRLAEACSRTLVKLLYTISSYTIFSYGKFHPFSRSSLF